jgi:hypothetical protein
MSAAYLAELAGAVLVVFVISRIIRLVFRSRPEPDRSYLAASITFLLAGSMAIMSGGFPSVGYVLALYAPPPLLWLGVDLVLNHWRTTRANVPKREPASPKE